MDAKRAVVDMLVTVTILPSESGKAIEPTKARAEWRG